MPAGMHQEFNRGAQLGELGDHCLCSISRRVTIDFAIGYPHPLTREVWSLFAKWSLDEGLGRAKRNDAS